ncbi:uncharacterized protein TNCV_4171791 [Trichonephila clavipes]|nr:uncharacterized protein TNCV_4171791 [Trichonephila clavipes]
MIWAKCPKEIFVNKRRVKRAVTEAVCEYNKGTVRTIVETQKAFGVATGGSTKQLATILDCRKQKFRKRRQNARLPPEAEEENCDLIVLDDMMNDVTSEISQMFTMGSHHKKYGIILITQNLFPRVKSMRDICLNAHYIILFRNNRDVSQAACFVRQTFPGRGKFFMDSYKKTTEEPFRYLLVDVHPRSPEVQRLRKSLFPDHGMINWVFVPKENESS